MLSSLIDHQSLIFMPFLTTRVLIKQPLDILPGTT